MLDPQRPLTDNRGGAGRRWIPRLLVAAGAVMLVWAAALVIDASVFQDAARRSLELELASHAPAPEPSRDAIGALRLPATDPLPERGSPIAELIIPRVRLSSIVLHGSDTQTLRRGPGHLEHTPLPGEPGNVAIAGHRDTFFSELRDVKVGDDIFLNTPRGHFHYRIAWSRVVAANDVSVLEPTREDVLTLVTCFPFWVLGPAPDRFVVRATRIEESGTTAVAPEVRALFVDVPVDPPPAENHSIAVQKPAAVPAALDDEALIRLAIERFRVAYNAWLVKHNEHGAGLLRLSDCDVAITGDQAEATCEASLGDATTTPHHRRTLTLEHNDGAWAIRSTTD